MSTSMPAYSIGGRSVGRNEKAATCCSASPRFARHLRALETAQAAIRHVVEWNGEPVLRVHKAFRSIRKRQGLAPT